MSRFLQQLLKSEEPMFSIGMHKLEQTTGYGGVDTRLIADITHAAHQVMRSLGLDPAASTAHEVYQALAASVDGRHENDLLAADFVLLSLQDEVVSFNLIDVIENKHHQLPFEQRIISHGQRSLRGEIIKRYIDHDRTDEAVTKQIATSAGLIVEGDDEYRAAKEKLVKGSLPTILAVGDIFTDAFIALDENEARIDTDADGNKRLSLPFGSKPPYDHVDVVQAVGPSPNAAVSFARLGVTTSLMAFLGDDQAGKDSLDYLAKEHVDSALISVKPDTKSNYYYVLRYGADRTILVHDEDYDYTWRAPAEAPDWIYLSLISPESWQLHQDMLAYLQEHPQTKLAFQPGTFHFKWGVEKLREVYKRSYIIVLNREEAVDITGRSYDSIKDLADGLHELGPEVVVITDGPAGSYASYDGKLLTIPNYPDPAPPLDRTGAGDAFASTIVAALALGEPLETALKWAPINSMSVVQKIGAQAGLLHKADLLGYLQHAPADYEAREFQGMKYQICVSGAASGETVTASHQLAYDLGKAIAERGETLITGATVGLPWFAAQGAFSVEGKRGVSIGFSPASSYREHVATYRLPTKEFDYINFTGMSYVGRDVHLVRSSDAVITVGGRMGSLHEFSTALESRKVCGVLLGSGGLADFIPTLVEHVEAPGMKEIIYDTDPVRLLEKVLAALDKKYSDFQAPINGNEQVSGNRAG